MNPLLGMKHLEEADWQPLPIFAGLQQISLSDNLDEKAKTGRRTRLVRFAPGTQTQGTLVHDYCEESYLVSGSLEVAGDPASRIEAPAYVFRRPGTQHGPFLSPDGCVMLEIQYYGKPE